jgi:hypothetical protein
LVTLALILLQLAANGPVSLETDTRRDRYYVGEPIRAVLRIRFDPGFFESNAVQLFQRELELPLQVDAKWIDAPPEAEGPTIALNDAVVRVRSPAPGRIEVEQTRIAREPGELILSAPRARYAYATKFTEDFIQGRVPADRREASVTGSPHVVTVLPLPQPVPELFSGAVGTALRVRTDASPRMVAVGAIVKLVLTIEGEGNLEEFEAPRLDRLEGFHVYGVIDEKTPARRVLTYDLAPLDGTVTEVPSIGFCWFDGPTAGYVTTATEPIPLSVHAEERDEPVEPDPEAAGWVLIWLAVFLILTLFVFFRTRGRGASAADPASEFHARDDVPDAFVAYLAARLGCSSAAVISPGLAKRLTEGGVPAELAGRTASLVEEMVASRYGGAESDDRADRARELVDALESDWPTA